MFMYDEYSPWKASHHLARLEQVRRQGHCVPVALHVSLTTKCNCRCFYCYVQETNKQRCDIDKDILMQALREAKECGAKSIELTGGGEPTLHKEFDDIAYRICEMGYDLGIVSNGYHINPQALAKAKWLRISIDTFDAQTYRASRKAEMPSMEPIVQTARLGSVIVGASCVITEFNYKKLVAFARTAKSMGFHNVWFKWVDNMENRSFIESAVEEMRRAKQLSDNDFKVFGNVEEADRHVLKSFKRCFYQFLTCYIHPDGHVFPCCSLQGRQDYVQGSIYESSVKDIFKKRRELQTTECPLACFWENKNQFMEYLVNERPKHVNFI